MISIAICDDLPEHLDYTEVLTQKSLPAIQAEIRAFPSADALLTAVRAEGFAPSLAILDIRLGEESGITLAKELNLLLSDCAIIFLSDYPDYISESYTARHVWYVLKSQAEQYLPKAVQAALSPSAEGLGILVKNRATNLVLPLGELLYLERVGRKLHIVGQKEDYLVTSSPASLIHGQLAPYLLRCHQGYWVNLLQVQALDKEEFILSNGKRIPISRTFREDARKRFFDRYR